MISNLYYGGELVPTSENASEDKALSVANSVDFHPRLKLCQGSGKEAQKGKVAKAGNYALITNKDEMEDLGDEVEIVICAARAKALQTGKMILTYFDPESPEFAEIKEKSKVKNSGCMYGPEYLIWLPNQNTYATLFMCSPTARRESRAVHSRLRKAALLKSHLIETEDYAWHGPIVKDLETEVTNLPPQEELLAEIEKFDNEQSSQVKMDTENTEDSRER